MTAIMSQAEERKIIASIRRTAMDKAEESGRYLFEAERAGVRDDRFSMTARGITVGQKAMLYRALCSTAAKPGYFNDSWWVGPGGSWGEQVAQNLVDPQTEEQIAWANRVMEEALEPVEQEFEREWQADLAGAKEEWRHYQALLKGSRNRGNPFKANEFEKKLNRWRLEGQSPQRRP